MSNDESDLRRMPRSPAWELFRLNAFRVLRLPLEATAQQATNEAADVLSILAVPDMPRPGEDELPWLGDADEIEIQRAAQRIEEPMSRLVDQALWFDFEGNAGVDTARAALRTLEADKISLALKVHDASPPDGDSAGDAASARDAAVLHLILALAAIHGRVRGVGGAAAHDEAGVALAWKSADGARRVDDLHAQIVPTRAPAPGLDPEGLLAGALTAWSALLQTPAFVAHEHAVIDALGDDLVTRDDAETIVQAIWTAIADAVAGELKHFLVAGQMEAAGRIASAIARAETPPHAWVPSFKPIRRTLASELEELGALVDDASDLDAVELYMRRVRAVTERWKPLDPKGFLGLDQLVDEAALRAFRRIKSIDDPLTMEAYLERAQLFEDLTNVAAKLARSESLRHRIENFGQQLEARRSHLCHFCGTKPAGKQAVVLYGKRETSRERVGYNQVRVTYQSLTQFVMRCDACADLQHWVYVRALVAAGALAISAFAMAMGLWGGRPHGEQLLLGAGLFASLYAVLYYPMGAITGGVVAAIVALVAGGIGMAGGMATATLAATTAFLGAAVLARVGLAVWMTPKGHRRYWDIATSEGLKRMTGSGFSGHITRKYGKGAASAVLAAQG